MLDVTLPTVLPLVFPPVKASPPPNLRAQVIVAAEAGVGIDPLSGRVTLAAIRITIDLRVAAGKLARRKKLRTRGPRHERSGESGSRHQAAQDQRRGAAPSHWENIQRYP
jgi:hypothetical protein